MGVSKNRGTLKWMVYNGNTYIFWVIWGYQDGSFWITAALVRKAPAVSYARFQGHEELWEGNLGPCAKQGHEEARKKHGCFRK